MRHDGLPDDAQPVRESGEIVGYIRFRGEPVPGCPVVPGFDTWRGAYGRRWLAFPTQGEAEEALRDLRRPRPAYDDWQVGEP